MNEVLARPIAVVVMNGDDWPVDGYLLKVRPTMPVELGVEVREDPALQQRIFGEVNASDNVAWLELHDC